MSLFVDQYTDLTSAEDCITSMSKVLQVHIQVEAIPLGYHCYEVRLIVPCLDGSAGTATDCSDKVVILIDVQLIVFLGIDIKVIE